MTAPEQTEAALPGVLSYRDFRLFLLSRVLAGTSMRMVMVAVGWQVYNITDDPLSLGWVALASLLPAIALLLPAGELADRYDRRILVAIAFVLMSSVCGVFTLLSVMAVETTWPYYTATALFGVAQSLYRPSATSMLSMLVPRAQLMVAFGWNASSLQIGTIAGPAVYAAIYFLAGSGAGDEAVYAVALASYLVGFFATIAQRAGGGRPVRDPREGGMVRVTAGLRYVWRREMLLGAISLELFASLVSGVTALLPIFARDILEVGAEGLGLLRAAPAIGATIVGISLAHLPLHRRAGHLMFAAVTASALATILFGASENFVLSFIALTMMGALDMVSTNFRQTLVQLATPDNMRGRVNSVQQLFVGSSSGLGDLISSLTATWFGAAVSVVAGGVATLAVAAIWMRGFPSLRKVDSLSDVQH